MYSGKTTLNVNNSLLEDAVQLKQASLDFFSVYYKVAYFSQNVFWTPKIKPWVIVHGFWPKSAILTSAKKDTIRKGISRGAEWRKFQIHSTFQ